MALNPEQRRLRASLAANARHARSDGGAATAKARQTFLARFEDEVDPRRELAPEERARRAAFARKAHFQRLALKSSTSRSKKTA